MLGLLDTLKSFLDGLRSAQRRLTPESPAGLDGFPSREQLERIRPQILELRDKYRELKALRGPCDREKAEWAVTELYTWLRLPAPTFLWFASPLQAARAAVLWNIMRAMLAVAEPTSDNKLVFTLDALEMAFIRRDSPDILKQLQDATHPIPPKLLRNRRTALLNAFDLFAIVNQQDELIANHISLRITRGEKYPEPHKVLDEWLTTWQAMAQSLNESNAEVAQRFDKFGEIFWSMSDADQKLILNRSRVYEFNPLPIFREAEFMFNVETRRFSFGNSDSIHAFFMEAMHLLGDQPTEAFYKYRETTQHCGWWRPYPDACLMVERPEELFFDANGSLHRFDAPAVRYRDGFEIYALQGIQVSKEIAWGQFTPREIEHERNTERRRVMIDRYGTGRYLKENGAAEIDRSEFGVLYAKDVPGDEPIYMVRVKNSTPEPDGSVKEYYLRVPPRIRTAREAVAWTFDLPQEEYKPAKET